MQAPIAFEVRPSTRQTPCRVRRRARLWACAVAASGIAVALAPGCATHQCDGRYTDYFGGYMLDNDTFVTNDWNEPWVPYRGNETLRIWFPLSLAGRIPKAPIGFLATDQTPNFGPDFRGGDNFSPAAGQLAYLNFLDTTPEATDAGLRGGKFWATNGSCADYFAHFEVDFIPVGSDAGASEAGSDATVDGDASQNPDAFPGAPDALGGATDAGVEASD
jgi:hypothetical protein